MAGATVELRGVVADELREGPRLAAQYTLDVVYELHDGHLHRQDIGADGDLDPEPTAEDTACERTDSFVDAKAGTGQRAATGTEEGK